MFFYIFLYKLNKLSSMELMLKPDQNSRSTSCLPDPTDQIDMTTMMVVKRNGKLEPVSFDKITNRITN